MKTNVCIVQQSVWKMEVQSVPLAAGYLKAYSEQDENIREKFNIKILNFNVSHTNKMILNSILEGSMPDILCFSVMGWNFKNFVNICKVYKQFKPESFIVLGGPHVSFQAEKVFASIPEADIIINGEGEETFKELLLSYSTRFDKDKLSAIEGISFNSGNQIYTTRQREEICDLEIIPSPYLTGAVPLKHNNGDLLYDCILLETNRGCPYSCAYCNWAGIIGKKIRKFPIQRLQAELEFFARNKVESIVLCDSNFGLNKEDEDFVDIFIKLKNQYGYPKNLETSWTRESGDIMFRILKKLKENKIKNSFSVSLQSLDKNVLKNIKRGETSLARVREIAEWARSNDMEFFIELIWGLPGEKPEIFIKNLNELSSITKKIAIYPLVLLPNSYLGKNRSLFELITIKETQDDFEYIISNNSITVSEYYSLTRAIFWVRLLSENMLFRNIWALVEEYLGLKFFDTVKLFDEYIMEEHPIKIAGGLRNMSLKLDIHNTIPEALDYIYGNIGSFKELVKLWWREKILKITPDEAYDFFEEFIEFEMMTLPVTSNEADRHKNIQIVTENNETYYLIQDAIFSYDYLKIFKNNSLKDFRQETTCYSFYYKIGFENYMYNQEFAGMFLGRPEKNPSRIFADEDFEAVGSLLQDKF